MKISELNLTELNSLFEVTEKYMNYVAKQVKINENHNKTKAAELHKLFAVISEKFSIILEEIKRRVLDVEN